MSLFAVIRRRGPAWDWSLPMRRQRQWNAHAEFMDALVTDGFMIAGGPLGNEDEALRVLHVFDASSSAEIETLLNADPWTPHLLETLSIEPWTILLGSLP